MKSGTRRGKQNRKRIKQSPYIVKEIRKLHMKQKDKQTKKTYMQNNRRTYTNGESYRKQI